MYSMTHTQSLKKYLTYPKHKSANRYDFYYYM